MSEATERAREWLRGVENDRTAIPFTDSQARPYRLLSAALHLIEAQEQTIINCSVKIGPNHLSRLRHAEREFEEATK